MANLQNIKIQLRTDTLSNWQSANPTLNNGEIAIVLDDNGNEKLKIGNGLSAFNDLKFLNQTEFKSEKIYTTELRGKSIAQGYNVKSTPTSIATGIFSEADGNFTVVHGIEAKALSAHDYSFVFNGINFPNIADRYVSHGEGTFSINPKDGLNGFYIGESTLSSILNKYFPANEISNYYTKSESNAIYLDLDSRIIALNTAIDRKVQIGTYADNQYSLTSKDLSVVTIQAEDYYKLVAEDKALSDVMYIVSSDNLDAHGQTIVNVASPMLSDDAATKSYVDVELSTNLSDYCTIEAATVALSTKVQVGNYADETYHLESSDLSVVKISDDDYSKLVAQHALNPQALYIISSDVINAHGQRILKVGTPLLSTDAATKGYVDIEVAKNKDHVLSSAQIIGTVLVLKFNKDMEDLSINLSAFVDNYDSQIMHLSSAISTIGEDYLDSNDKLEMYNDLLSPDEVKLYKGPGNKDISLSVGTGTQLCVYTASLSDFCLSNETSSASQISTSIASKVQGGSYSDNQYYLHPIDLSVVSIGSEDFHDLVDRGIALSDALYAVSTDYINAYDTQVKNVAEPTEDTDAATKGYADRKIMSGKYSEGEYDLSASNLSIVNIGSEDFHELVDREQVLSNTLYVVSSDYINAYDTQVRNVAEPTLSSDAATKNYVDKNGGVGRYKMETLSLSAGQISMSGSTINILSCQVKDLTMNTVTVSQSSTPVVVYLPPMEESGARDFIVRVECTVTTVPSLAFFGSNGESCDFEATDSSWSTLETGVNLFNFTETKR